MSKQKQKEPLSLMIVKIALAIAVFMGLGTIIIGGGVVIMKYYNGEVNNRIAKTVDQETYYQKLAKDCEKFKKSKFVTDYDCCLQSVEIMQKNNFKPAPKNGCLDGFQINSLWCSGAYQWCEPVEEDCKKHGEIPDYTAPENDMGAQCCKGLKHKIQKKYFDENCVNLYEKYGYGGYAGICIDCGDGICDAEFENKCNCPEDCGDNTLVSCCALECEKYRYGTCPEGCTKACVGSCPDCHDCGGKGSCYCSESCEDENDELFYCGKDSDCGVYFSHCDCQYHCVNKNIEIGDCAVVCDETGPIISECVCENNKCIDKKLSTSDWQTYRNEEFGFEVKYPEEWTVVKGPSGEDIHFKEGKENNCNIFINDRDNKTIEQLLSVNQSRYIEIQNIVIDGTNGVIASDIFTIGNDYKVAIFPHKDLMFFIGCEKLSINKLDQILSTFKFTES